MVLIVLIYKHIRVILYLLAIKHDFLISRIAPNI